MAYQIYITDAIVCGSKPHNTSDKNYLLFTRELGMLWATARSVREERSRQRYALQDFSLIRVSLVRGKTGWRVGSTESITNFFLGAVSRPARGGVVYLVKQLRRYIQGEQPLPAVFEDVCSALAKITLMTEVSDIIIWQNTVMTRLLHTLGYAHLDNELQSFITAPTLEIAATTLYRPALATKVEQLINRAEQVSHL